MMEALDGFLMILANDGDITYVSDNIKDYLGINKVSFCNGYLEEVEFVGTILI